MPPPPSVFAWPNPNPDVSIPGSVLGSTPPRHDSMAAPAPPPQAPSSPQPCLRHLLVGIGEAEGAVVAHPGYTGAAGREADAVHPPAAAARLEHQLPEGHLGAPRRGAGSLLHLLDVG